MLSLVIRFLLPSPELGDRVFMHLEVELGKNGTRMINLNLFIGNFKGHVSGNRTTCP